MAGYILNFSVYTLAMVGVIFAALFVFKGVMSGRGFSGKSDFLGVEDTMSLSPRKRMYVVRAGAEKFLIAADLDKTTLIAKLQSQAAYASDKSRELDTLYGSENLEDFASVIDIKRKGGRGPMMREIARKLEF